MIRTRLSLLLLIALVTVAALVVVSRADATELYASKQFAGKRLGNQAWQYRWQVWLPDKWQRVGACETGYGKRPGNWQHYNSGYAGAFGFAHSSWSAFKPVSWWPNRADQATPWQQYQTALAIHRRYGFSGWGCKGA